MKNRLFEFKDVLIGDYFYLVEDGEIFDYQKISATEAQRQDGVITDFSPYYSVGRYPPSVEEPEFPVYYDGQGREHAEY